MIVEKKEYLNLSQAMSFVDSCRKSGKTIVTTNGCFDIIHAGHIQYLEEAAKLGDILIVGLNSDNSVKRLKGEDRPVQNQTARLSVMAALKPVDAAFIFEEDTPENFLASIKPDIHVKGGDYSRDLPEKSIVENSGGKIVILSFKDGYSTTGILDKVKK